MSTSSSSDGGRSTRTATPAVRASARWRAQLSSPKAGAIACGGVLDTGLQAFGQPQRDASGRRLVGRRRGGVVVDDDELWLGAGEADVDAGAVELRLELERRLAQRLEQPPGERRLERDGQEVGGSGRRLVTDGGDGLEILLQRLYVAVDLHGATMTSE